MRWRGWIVPKLIDSGTIFCTQNKRFAYTITLLVVGAALFHQSLARRSDLMRKAGLAVIGLAVAKMFLIDIAGLGGVLTAGPGPRTCMSRVAEPLDQVAPFAAGGGTSGPLDAGVI